MAVSTRTRFEVLKRDLFACQYCGRSREEDGVKLHVDHILAVANGGSDSMDNLIAACADCNLGKSAVPLNVRKFPITADVTARLKAHVEYQEESRRLADLETAGYDAVVGRWQAWWGTPRTYPYSNAVRSWIRQFGVAEVIACLDAACDKCGDSYNAARYLGGIMRNKKAEADLSEAFCVACGGRLDGDLDGYTLCASCVPADIAAEESAPDVDEISLEVSAWDSLADAAGF